MAWDGVTPSDPSFTPNYVPTKTYTKGTVHSLQDVDPYNFAGGRNAEIRNLAEGARGNLLANLFSGFLNLGSLLGDLADAFRGLGSFGLGPLKLIKDHAVDQGIRIDGYGQQLQDLADFVGTGVTTPSWSSAGGRDLVTFPDTMMQKHWYFDGSSYTWTEIPAFTQQATKDFFGSGPFYGTADFAFLRGGRDTPTPMEVIRIITGGDASLFDIRSWFLGLYVYDKPNARMVKVWDSGDIKAALTSQRRRYHIGTGMTQTAANDQLLAVATLQLAPGGAQGPRSIGCINLTGISEEAGTVPQARHATLSNQSTLPASVPMSSLTWNLDRLMWAAVGATAT
jgi:hypothetical protein